MNTSAQGLRVLVTAGAAGIGRAFASTFSEAGAKAKALGITFEAYREQFVSTISLRRMLSTQDIANMALFLATPAGQNISGQALSVCGDHGMIA